MHYEANLSSKDLSEFFKHFSSLNISEVAKLQIKSKKKKKLFWGKGSIHRIKIVPRISGNILKKILEQTTLKTFFEDKKFREISEIEKKNT